MDSLLELIEDELDYVVREELNEDYYTWGDREYNLKMERKKNALVKILADMVKDV